MKKPKNCPNCKSERVVVIQYGLPMDMAQVERDIKAEKIILGGCGISESLPDFSCLDCAHEWKKTISKKEKAKKEKTLNKMICEKDRALKKADSRGILEAKVNQYGFIRCPFCKTGFNVDKHHFTWDGERHLTCKTRIKLIRS